MQIFAPIYQKTLQLSKHRHAPFWLGLVSFIEAIFFPIPPDVMLMPMSMTQPQKAVRFAFIAGIFSTLGGMIGYAVGYFAADWVTEIMQHFGYGNQWHTVMGWFDKWGIVIVFVAGFSPIPYKLFTLSTGVMQMAFFPFVIAAFISRMARFLLVAKLAAWGGQRFADKLQRFIEIIGWSVVLLAIIAIIVIR
ncbi:YqaA family protein [Actinobacillus delphinicola]|uniref:SNARE associated Golgi protein n=1 Tax=Actinobacillus delphinicola TaxID=51161 RepID=A0A448TU99_9PAST|nr:YqaA family protein [Actinobacillus delphinicola]VEJ09564.1 SNARE associated Golgi protein [Actinobacillus delphinicola]